MTSISTINVPFHGANLCIVNRDGNPYVPMKPIIEDMGLDWASQFTKLKKRFSKGIVEITIPSKGGEQSMICLAMHKLTGWLYSIMPNKVKPEIRDKVIKYQEECDDVLYEYWTTGEVKKKHKSTVQERNPLKNAVNLLVSKKGIMYPEAYSLVHQKFNVSSIEELTADQIPDAVEYIHKFVLEGEYIPKETPREVTQERANRDMDVHHVNALAKHYEAIYTAWKVELYPALVGVDSPIAYRLRDRLQDGYSILIRLQESLNGKHPVLIK
ncbi:phage antirepressor N-terminal domain-containing protein [Proteus mirabilis]|uniref:phage antirepressor N-terminal domain-containing protein n=1 Tax=Proteus mirabilis TaxID=584 RepID=UPI0020254F26|nr:phage antirepressor N-terminal domain-containing protein [Proteus mirabilis]MCL8569181.1 phage antirepressor N-terminal domain-containing protein [Proteus mirabilis]MCL8622989.1 phage antirepressor N-terminal domain-containing protein [Proteus mirabilis]